MKTFREILERQEQLLRTAPQVTKIEALKAQLSSSDYKIIKCAECSLAGLEAPYDIAALHAERQALRDRINALEAGVPE